MFTERQQMYKRSIKEKDILDESADQLALHGMTQKEGIKKHLYFICAIPGERSSGWAFWQI